MNIDIIEGNKLIAEFMGAKWNGATENIFRFTENLPIEGKNNYKTLEYHSSWDWLMPVVEKIEYLGCQTFNSINVTIYSRFKIEHNHIILYWSSNHNYQLQLEVLPDWKEGHNSNTTKEYKRVPIDKNSTKLEALYIAVVEFIKWYNINRLTDES